LLASEHHTVLLISVSFCEPTDAKAPLASFDQKRPTPQRTVHITTNQRYFFWVKFYPKTKIAVRLRRRGLDLTEVIDNVLKNQIENAVHEQIDPLFDEKPVLEKWKRLMMSENSAKRIIRSLFSGQPRALARFLDRETKAKKNKEKSTLLKAFSYLLLVEVDANFLIDIFLLMMVAKGNDFHIEPDYNQKFIRHATSLADLESASVSLASKLDFLKACGLSCFEKYIDRKLRNKIAHMDFVISKEGKFKMFDNDKRKEVVVERKLEMLRYFTSLIYERLNKKVEWRITV
jgi:hypothetical protein